MPLICQICSTSNKDGSRFCKECGATLLKNGRYAIVNLIGQGGMGSVYKALDTQNNNRTVALKELLLPQGVSSRDMQEAERLFQAEAHILSGLYHPNIIDVAGVFQEKTTWYLVMSFVPGETLEDLLERTPGHKLPLSDALDIGKQLASALHYLHTWQNPQGMIQPIIFRDLKPANVMVTSGMHVVLIDFGIARLFKQGQQKDTAAFGSVGYAPPEQFGRMQTTPQSDIYSLGRLLHCMLTGEDPGDRGMQDPGRSVYDSRHPVSANLDTLLQRMQDIKVEARPKSAREVHNVLDYVLLHWSDPALPRTASTGITPPPPATNTGGKRAGTQKILPSTKKATAAVPAYPLPSPAPIVQNAASPFPSHVTIFSIFAQEDIQQVTAMKGALEGTLRQSIKMTFIDESLITPGTIHQEYMENALTRANIILLFVSVDFIASTSCSAMTNRALQRHQKGEATVVPIVLRPCTYTYTAFSHFSMYPQDRDGRIKPITSWSNRDTAMSKVVDAFTELLKDLHTQGQL